MSLRQKARLAAIFPMLLIWIACGDTFRPVAVPLIKPGGDPALNHQAFIISNNNGGIGSIMQVDTSGDTVSVVRNVGHGPVHVASTANGLLAYVANFNDDSISVLTAFQGAGDPTQPALPVGSKPVFVLPSDLNVYVANSGNRTVSVVSQSLQVVAATIPVGANPVALVA